MHESIDKQFTCKEVSNSALFRSFQQLLLLQEAPKAKISPKRGYYFQKQKLEKLILHYQPKSSSPVISRAFPPNCFSLSLLKSQPVTALILIRRPRTCRLPHLSANVPSRAAVALILLVPRRRPLPSTAAAPSRDAAPTHLRRHRPLLPPPPKSHILRRPPLPRPLLALHRRGDATSTFLPRCLPPPQPPFPSMPVATPTSPFLDGHYRANLPSPPRHSDLPFPYCRDQKLQLKARLPTGILRFSSKRFLGQPMELFLEAAFGKAETPTFIIGNVPFFFVSQQLYIHRPQTKLSQLMQPTRTILDKNLEFTVMFA